MSRLSLSSVLSGAVCLLSPLALAAPKTAAPKTATGAEQPYDGPRLAFVVPVGATVKETTDVVSDYALEVTLASIPGGKPIALRVLASNGKVTDPEVESAATSWRDARLRNRASWGVPKRGETRAEVTHVGSRRVVRLVDQMGSVLGATRQIMMCGSISARLICVVGSGLAVGDRPTEAALSRVLETVTVVKRP